MILKIIELMIKIFSKKNKKEPTPRERFVIELIKYLGSPYKYGGQDRNGIDCSGLVVNCLKAAGFEIEDMTAAGLRKHFKDCEIEKKDAQVGDLYFYGKSRINHVCVCYSVWDENYKILAGANSGTSKTKTFDDAWKSDAFVKLVRDNYWSSQFVCVINPFKKLQEEKPK